MWVDQGTTPMDTKWLWKRIDLSQCEVIPFDRDKYLRERDWHVSTRAGWTLWIIGFDDVSGFDRPIYAEVYKEGKAYQMSFKPDGMRWSKPSEWDLILFRDKQPTKE